MGTRTRGAVVTQVFDVIVGSACIITRSRTLGHNLYDSCDTSLKGHGIFGVKCLMVSGMQVHCSYMLNVWFSTGKNILFFDRDHLYVKWLCLQF